MTGHTPWPAVINLGNSLIGVSILAMPFCFKECGLILGCLLLFLGSKLNKYSCQLLLRASKVTRKNSYEMLAYHTLGSVGKLAVEMCIICFLIACCVAYFIIMGDLGPAIVSKWLGIENDDRLRAGFLVFLAMFVILPLCQKRNLDSISNISVISVVFYLLFTIDIIIDCIPTLLAGDWIYSITYWNTSGLLRGTSIFSAAFSCQTVLFAVYETLRERNPKVMETVVSKSINLVWTVYFAVGFFGYVLYHNDGSPKGDILLDFQPSFMSEVLRLGFSFSVALSFPLAVFPCRASIYTLFFASSHSLENPHGGGAGGTDFIPPGKFRFITVLIVVGTLILGITIPNVETMLGINGAVMGNLTCFIFPALIVLKTQNLPGKNFAKVLLFIGIFLMMSATYSNLQKAMETNTAIEPYKDKAVNLVEDNVNVLEERKGLGDGNGLDMLGHRIDGANKLVADLNKDEPAGDLNEAGDAKKADSHKHSDERQEPAIPHEPEESKEVVPDEREVVEEKEELLDEDRREDERGVEKAGEKEGDKEEQEVELDKRKADVQEDGDLNKEGEVREDQRGIEDGGEEKQDEAERQGNGDEEKDTGGEVEAVEKREAGQDEEGEKRHKKEAKVIQKQSKKIKELEEMQKKHAEVIENQANALEFLLKKQQEEAVAVPDVNQPVGVAAVQQQGIQPGVLQNEQLAAQQQPVMPLVQNQQPLVQQNQQPVLQNQQPVLQNQQPVFQNEQLVLQDRAPVLQNQQPILQNQQPVLQNQQSVLQNQQPVLQDQQPILQNQQPVLENQQPVLQNQQPVLQNQQPILQNQIVAQDQQFLLQNQQQPVLQNQQPVLQNQQAVLQDQYAVLQNDAAVLQNQQPLVQNQQPLVQQQPVIQNQQPVLQNQQPVLQNQQPIVQNQQPVFQNQQQQMLQQQLLPQQGEGLVMQQDGGLAAQGGPVVPQVIMQNDAVIGQQQGNIPIQQQVLQSDSRPVVQLNQQQVPGQPGQLVPGQQVPGQLVPGQQVPGQLVPGQQVPQQPPQVVQLQPQLAQGEPQPLMKDPQQQLAQQQVDVGGNIQANLQPIQLQVVQDQAIVQNDLHLNAGDNQNIGEQMMVDLPDKIELQKRDVQLAVGMNQRALQSHQYEEGGSDDDEAGAGVGVGEVEQEGEGEEKEEGGGGKVEASVMKSQDVGEAEGHVSVEVDGEKVIKEGQDNPKSDGLEGEEGKDEDGKRDRYKTKHSKKEKEDKHKEEELLQSEGRDL